MSDNSMSLNTYQLGTSETAIYPEANEGTEKAITYALLGLVNESGEVAGKYKKVFRDDNGELSDAKRIEMLKELGDVLWYVARLADELKMSLGEVAERNLEKLEDRMNRGVIGGSGDNR